MSAPRLPKRLCVLFGIAACLMAVLWGHATVRCRRAEALLGMALARLHAQGERGSSEAAVLVRASLRGELPAEAETSTGAAVGPDVFRPGNVRRAKAFFKRNAALGERFVRLSDRIASAEASGKETAAAEAALMRAVGAATRRDADGVERVLDEAETAAESLTAAYPGGAAGTARTDADGELRVLLWECRQPAVVSRAALCEGSAVVDRLLLAARHCLAAGEPERGLGPARIAAVLLGVRPLPSAAGNGPAVDEADSPGDLPSATAAEVARLTEAAGKLAGAIRASGTPAVAAEALLDDARACLAEGRPDRAGLLARSALALLGVNEETIARTAARAAAENEEP